MIKGGDIYKVFSAIVPLYVAMALGYFSLRRWWIFTPEQCSGINRFVAVFAVPLLSFNFIANNDPYAMHWRFLAADSLQKVVILVALCVWNALPVPRGNTTRIKGLDWLVTFFALSCMPNTLVMGIPLLKGMYGEFSTSLMVQIVVLQSVVWNTLLLFLYELRAAKQLLAQQFPNNAEKISRFKVEDDVVSLCEEEGVKAEVGKVEEDGRMSVLLTRTASHASSNYSSFCDHHSHSSNRNSFQSAQESIGGLSIGCKSKELREEKEKEIEEGRKSDESSEKKREEEEGEMPPLTVITRLILLMVWRKLIRNPNTYASVLGLAWSLISFRWNIQMPIIVKGSYTILSNTGLGMAMFGLGLFMGLQEKMIGCGKGVATFAMAVRFVTGPLVAAAAAMAVGIRGLLLQVTIVQAALPQGIVPFVFAKEYNLHADILSTSVIFGMIIALPITLLYYVVLGL